jgi:hypothetical protein
VAPEKSADGESVSPAWQWVIDPVGRVRVNAGESGSAAGLAEALRALYGEQVPFVAEVFSPPWLPLRAQAQRESAGQIGAFHDFQFTDRSRASGIRWVHQIVDDAGRDYKGVHYDHGNGVPIADVDGDGRLDAYFVNQRGRNALYRNLGDGRFEDVTDAAGVGVGDRICVSASFADIDNDGDPDLYVTSVREGNLLFRNVGGGKFEDITAESGLGYHGHSGASVFFDYDRDGRLDVLVCNVGKYTTEERGPGGYYVGFKDAFAGHLKDDRTELSRLYHNVDGLHFADVTSETGLEDRGWCGDAVILDGNGDGWPDVYTLNMQGNDEYYQNDGGRKFLRRSRELFPKTPWGAMGGATLDFDGDGDLDLFVTDMHSDMTKDILADPRSEVSLNTFSAEEKLKALTQHPESILKTEGQSLFGNAFYRNDGPDEFTEISDQIGAENYWPWGLTVADFNADGFEDAFVASSMNYPYRYGVNSVLLNDGGRRFADAEFILGVEPRQGGRTAQPWFLLDCNQEQDELTKKVCTGRTGEIVVWGSLGTRSSAVFDIDGDGDLDILTNEFNDAPLVLVSNLTERRTVRRLEVALQGVQSNRAGIGARVEVVAGGRRLVQDHDGRSGYLSQSVAPLYFGLDEATEADEIVVVWPSGVREVLAGPFNSGTLVQITEAAATAPTSPPPPVQ